MERRSFLKASALAAGATITSTALKANPTPMHEKEVYELKVFQLTSGGSKNKIKNFYTNIFIPYLNDKGVKVGVFNEFSLEDPPRLFVLLVYKNPESYIQISKEIKTDSSLHEAEKKYLKESPEKPVFERFETFLMEAFDGIPQLKFPDKNRGLLELRTYESYNEDAGLRKIKMFNSEELPLFEKVGLHPVFFGQLMAGRHMPALTYMLWFKDMDEREANWKKFRESEGWKVMRGKEEYANTVSKVRKIFLTPADYSQI